MASLVNGVVEDLKALRKLFERSNSWCQGALDGPDGSHCLLGGINKVKRHMTGEHYAYRSIIMTETLQKYCKSKYNQYGMLGAWNDQGGRTREDVLALIDKAISEQTIGDHQ